MYIWKMDCKDVFLSTGRNLTRSIPKLSRSIHSVESILRNISKLIPLENISIWEMQNILNYQKVASFINIGDCVLHRNQWLWIQRDIWAMGQHYDRCYPRAHCLVCRNVFAVQITISEGDLVGISFLPGRKYSLFSCACAAQGGAGDLEEHPV
jgi:hypothetical protein